jgi:hypothetical protein
MTDRKVQIIPSRDGGHTFQPCRERELGEQGQYRTRVRETRFGQAEQFVLKLRITSSCKLNLIGAVMDAEVGQ